MIDLHVHSLYSDGSYSPTDVVRHAAKGNVSAISLTDHDCILGLPEARKTASSLGLQFIDGVELEAYTDIESGTYIHVLAYNIKNLKTMGDYLDRLRIERIDAVKKYIELLKSKNLDITYESVCSLTPGRHLTPNHIAVWLVKNHFYSSFKEAKSDYLLPSSSNYIKRNYHPIDEIIHLILECGGIPVLAHPCRLGYSNESLDLFVAKLTNLGLRGIEAYYSSHSILQTRFYLSLAQKYNLIVTAGSDYHGYDDSGSIGMNVPNEKNIIASLI